MSMKMKVKLWGVRGSLPAPIQPDVLMRRLEEVLTQYEKLQQKTQVGAKAFLETLPVHKTGGYGGNTSCGEVTFGPDRLIIDGGSGLRALGEHILRTEPQTSDFHMYFTHFHWDHLIGLPFFTPLYIKGKTVHFYSVDEDMERSLHTMFKKPNFPVPYEVITKQVQVHRIQPRQPFKVGGLTATPYQLDHPDPCWGVRVEAAGKSLAWAVDNEGIRHSPEQLGADLPMFTKADLMIYDAQYSFDEALEKINWGHSSAPIGMDLAIREQIKHVVFVHHDPAATDEQIRHAEEQTGNYFDELGKQLKRAGRPAPELRWSFGREGEVIEV